MEIFSFELTVWDYVAAVVLVLFAVYYYYFRRTPDLPPPPKMLPKLKKQDMDLQQLAQYNGSNEDGRICLAVDGKVFDVTRAKHLYGKDGPYGLFAGCDASRGLATFSIEESAVKRTTPDDLSDLTLSEIDQMKEWSAQFQEKYPVVGRLLKPGETPDVYTDEEDSTAASGSGGESNSAQSKKAD